MADWNTPPTFTSGDFLSAADMNTYVSDNTAFLRNTTSVVGGGPFYQAGVQVAGGATSPSVFFESGTLVTPDYDYVMTVMGSGSLTANPAATTVFLIPVDTSSVSLPSQVGLNNAGFTVVRLTEADSAASFAFVGSRQFTAGTTAAFKVQYHVSNSTVNIDVHLATFVTPI